MQREHMRRHLLLGIQYGMERVDGAKPISGSNIRMDGPGYLREVLIAARRRMEEHVMAEGAPARSPRSRRLVGGRLSHWCRRLVKLPRRWAPSVLAMASRTGRDRARARASFDDLTRPGVREIAESDTERLRDALTSLRPEDFGLLIMRHVDQISAAQIAEKLGISERAVKYRLLRALLRLRELMEP